MKKLLTILTLLLTVCNLSMKAEVVYSGDAHNVGSWNALQLPIADYPVLAKASAGDVIAVTVTAVESDARITLQDTSWQGFADEYNCESGVHYFVLSEDNAATVSTNGLIVTGEKYTISKVELLYKKTLWTGTLNGEDNWTQSDALDKSIFTGLTEGNLLGLTVSAINTGDYHMAVLRYNYESNILEFSFSETGTKVKELTSTDISNLTDDNAKNLVACYLSISEICTYVENKYKVTITTPTNGTITVKNGDDDVSSGDYVIPNTSLTLTAAGTTGYEFDSWTSPDALATESASTSLTVTEDVTIAADFKSSKTAQTLSTGSKTVITDGGVTIASSLLADISTGDVLTVNVSGVASGATYQLKYAGGEWSSFQDATDLLTEATSFTYTISDETVLSNVKTYGIFITGNGYICGDVTMSTAATIGEAGTHSDPTLTITPSDYGTIVVKNGDDEVTSDTKVAAGTSLSVVATPNSGYEFESWTSPSSLSNTTSASTTVEMTTGDMTLTASFVSSSVPDFSLDGFTIADGDVSLVTYDASTHTMTTADNSWKGVGLWIGNNSTYSGSSLLVKTSEAAKLKIMVSYVNDGGEADPLMDSEAVTDHLITLDSSKKILSVAIQNQEAGTVTFTEFALDPTYTLTITAPSNGSFTVNDGTSDLASGASVAYGTSLTLTPTANDGYSFSKWTINETDVTDNPYTFTLTEATTVAATFIADAVPEFSLDGFVADEGNSYDVSTYALTTASGWTGGQLWIGNNSTYSGSTLVVRTSDACQLKITVGYTDSSSSELSDEESSTLHAVSLDSSKNIQKVIIQNQEAGTVTFTEFALAPTYTLTITAPSNGSFTVNDGTSDLASGASVAYGTSLTLTPTANDGYSFSKWTINETDVTDNPYTFEMTDNTTVSATFTVELTEHVLTSTSATVENWSGGDSFPASMFANMSVGDRIVVTISALPDADYHQIALQNTSGSGDKFGGTQTAEVGEYSFMLTSAALADLQANGLLVTGYQFTYSKVAVWSEGKLVYTLTLNEATGGSYTVNDGNSDLAIGATVTEGTSLKLTATPDDGNSFEKWTVNGWDVTDNPYSFTPTSDVEITATFDDGRTEKTLVEKSQAISEGDITVNRGLFSNAVAGDILRIYATGLGDDSKIALEPADYSGALDGANWTGFTESPFELELTATLLETLKAKNLLVRGENFTFTKATLCTKDDLGSEVTDQYTLTVTSPEHGNITITKGTEVVAAGAFDKGTVLTLTATADDGYSFSKWNIGETENTDNPLTYTINSDVTITAVFEENVPATPVFDENGKMDLSRFVSDGTAGYSYADGKGTITTGDEQAYKGVVVNLSEDDYVKGTKMIFKFQNETSAQIHVNYAGEEWADGAQVSTTGTEIVVPLDATKDVNRIDIQLWNANTTAVLTEVSISNKCTLTASAANGTIAVEAGGETTTATEFEYGTELTLTATPSSSDYSFKQWVVGESTVTDNPYTFTITADTEITAEFKSADADVIWIGSQVIDWSNGGMQTITVTEFDNLKIADQLVFTIEPSVEGLEWPQLQLSSKSDGTPVLIGTANTAIDDNTTEVRYYVTKAMLNDITENGGFIVSGSVFTLKKVKIERYTGSEDYSKAIWIGEKVYPSNWSVYTSIGKDIFANATVGQVIRMKYKDVKTGSAMSFSYDNDGWKELPDAAGVTPSGLATKLTITEDMLTALKAGGLIISGVNFTLTSVELLDASDIKTLAGTVPVTGDDWVWTSSETPSFTVNITNENNEAVTAEAVMLIKTDKLADVTTLTESKEIAANGSETITFTYKPTDAGFYNATVIVNDETVRSFNFGYAPTEIVSAADKQNDFDSYWAAAKSQLAAVEASDTPVLTEMTDKSTSKRKVYLVEFKSIPDGTSGDPVTVRGYYCEPTDGVKHPVLMHYQGYDSFTYGPGGTAPDVYCPSGDDNPDYAEFVLSTRGQALNNREPYKSNGGNPYGQDGWFKANFGDKDSYYYRGAYMDVVRAIDFMATRETSDMDNLFAEGQSQGGAFTYAAAALSGRTFKAIAPAITFMGDFPDYFELASWPGNEAKEMQEKLGWTDAQLYAFMSYYDTKNLATMVSCPAITSIGVQDNVCPPHTNIAPYNNVTTDSGDKQVIFNAELQHATNSEWNTVMMAFFDKYNTWVDPNSIKLEVEEKRTLWTGSENLGTDWPAVASQSATVGGILEEGEKFLITVSAIEKDATDIQVMVRSANYEHTLGFSKFDDFSSYPAEVKLILSATDVESFKNGFHITGKNCTITKVVLYKPTPVTRTERTLLEKEQAVGDGIEINRGLFSNAAEEDVLKVYFEVADGVTAKINLEDMDYNGIENSWPVITTSPYAYTFTAAALKKIQNSGMRIRGENFTFLKATLYTEKELGKAITDGGDDEDDISNANASENTKKVYNVLKDLYGKKIVSGVVANIDWNTTEAENVYEWTGKYPAMNVFDYINLHASKDVNPEGWLDYSDITPAKNWWKAGGIVGAMWHWQTKANNGTDYTCTPGTAAGETSFDASKVYVDGTSENALAKQQLDQLCGYFAKMQDAGIPVVWRPLHEGSGNVEQYSGGTAWFWWGAKGAEVYKKLWQWMYYYMVKTKGLNNLIWVWTSQTGDNNWYPGDDYVDIIGRDNYGATAAKLATEYEQLKEAYPNKMITLAECGNSDDAEMATISSIWDEGSRWSWFMTWYDSDYNQGTTTTHKHTSKTWWTNAVGKDYVVTRDQMKELLGQDDSDDDTTGVDIGLDDLNEGWNSTYDATTKTITTTGEWAARGWYIGDDRYSQKGSITVKYEAVDFAVTLKMEYTNANGESKSVSAGAAAGETEVELDIPSDVKTIEKVYITYHPIGSLKLTAATVNDKVVDNRTEKTLVEKSQAIADGDIKINRGLFSNAAAKDVIRIYATGLSEASKIALEPADYSGAIDGANWTDFTESPFELKLTASALATIQEKGLLVRGENFTFLKAVLYTEKELGAEITDTRTYTLTINAAEHGTITVKKGSADAAAGTFDENTELTLTATPDEGYQFVKWQKNGEDAGTDNVLIVKMDADISITAVFEKLSTPIIDKETGEVDMKELTAQDAATTTVTYDAGTETVTMTTTEAYKAAQIWFNTPEEVMGNVLLVDIAEAPVNVTVTVKYTDGTESSITPTTAGAQRAAVRRAAEAGTRIAVPVYMGKMLQSIEVKNAEAGTIHITRMAIVIRNVFTDGKADLSMAKAQSSATYDVGTYTLATTKGWTGLTITPLATETVKGVELMVKFAANAKVKVAVEYTDGEGPNTIMDTPARYVKMTLDANKAVKEITIQPTEAAIVRFTEVAVNQTATPDDLPEPVFTDGKADLSKLTVQDASRVMYNAETYKMATTDGWIGVELNTSEAETVSGTELAVIFTEPAKVKVTVIYNDNTQTEVIADQAQEETRLLLDASKSIKQIQVQPTEAGALQFKAIVVRQTVTPEPEPVYLFNAQGVANLSLFQPMGDNAVYDTAKHQLTTTENWAGIQVWLDNPQAVKGNVLSMKLAEENANVRITVGYTDGTENSADAGDANATETGTEIPVANDATKEIQKVMIQMPEAGIVTLLSISGIEFTVSELAEGESRLLWKNSQGEHLSWNDICRKGEAYGAVLKEDQQLYIAIASRDADNDWPKVMVRDLNGNTVGDVLELNKIKQFPYVARIELTADMVEQMADGFSICGDGITVTRIDIYQPYAPQPGDINLKALNGGWNSTYDAKTHTITTTARWAACGWDIGDGRYNDSDLILVKFEAVDFPVTLKMEYTDADGRKQATSAGVAAGSTAAELAVPGSLLQIDKVYLIWQKPASLTLTSAEVLKTSQETVTLDLALFEAMGDKVTYDNEAYIMTSQEGYTGIQLWLGDANAIEDGQLMTLTTANDDAKLRLTVGYTDGTEASADGTGSVLELELDDLRNIQKVMIQNLEAGTVTLTSLKVATRVFSEPAIPIRYNGTTDIDTLSPRTDDGEWYNLNGQRTSAPRKGVYIRNGRKVIK